MFTGWLSGKLQTGKVSYFAYPAFTPFLYSWYNWDKHVASFPLQGPGAATTTKGLVVFIYEFAPYPSSLTIVFTSVGYPFVNVWIYESTL